MKRVLSRTLVLSKGGGQATLVRTLAIHAQKAPASKAVGSYMDGAKSKTNYHPEKQKCCFQVWLKGTQERGGRGPDYSIDA